MYKTQRAEPRDIKNVTLYADDYHGVLDWFGSDRDSEAVREFVCGNAISIIYRTNRAQYRVTEIKMRR